MAHFIKYELLNCVKCKSNLKVESSDKNEFLACSNCSLRYIIIDGVAILLSNSKDFIAQTLIQLDQYIKDELGKIKSLEKRTFHKFRKAILSNIVDAKKENLVYFQKSKSLIEEHLSISDILGRNEINNIGYLTSWAYLKRDWSETKKENGREIFLIKKKLFDCLKSFNNDFDSCYILGAGTGRFVWDFQNTFKRIFASDYSYTMVKMFNDIQNFDLPFNEINLRNKSESKEFITKRIATTKNTDFHENKNNNINYFVADALYSPFKNSSISVVFSIYFSDVVSMNSLFIEIKRILKPNGLLIHFGPLEYHFENEDDMLAIDEVRILLKKNNFEIIEEDFINTIHDYSKTSLVNKTYKNWFFIAQKKEGSYLINSDTLFVLNRKIEYTITETFSLDIEETSSKLVFDGTNLSYNNAELVLNFIKRMNGKLRFIDIVNQVKSEYTISDEDLLKFNDLLEELIIHNVINIKRINPLNSQHT